MAKKKKTTDKKTKKRFNEDALIEIYGITLFFLAIIGVSQLGFVGETMMHIVKYFVGNYYGAFFLLITYISCFLFIKGKIPDLLSALFVGIYLIMAGLLMWASTPSDSGLTGMAAVENYFSMMTINLAGFDIGGGLVGVILYATFSVLFGSKGTMFVVIFFIIIGVLLLSGRSYALIVKTMAKKTKTITNTTAKKIKEVKINHNDKKLSIPKFKVYNNGFVAEEESTNEKNKVEIKEKTNVKKKRSETPKKETRQELTVEEEISFENKIVTDEYQLPPISLLKENKTMRNDRTNETSAKQRANTLQEVLDQFGVKATVTGIHIGPTVTKYELKPDVGVRVNRIASLQDDIKLALAAKEIRLETPIPGKSAIGIEIPNNKSILVTLKEVLDEIPKSMDIEKLTVGLGRNIMGDAVYTKLDAMPHLLVCGATGAGKSVCINGILISLLLRSRPDEVKLILIDPKRVELGMYNGIGHLMLPVVTDPKKASVALKKVVLEMEKRYELFAASGAKNIKGYNKQITDWNLNITDEAEMKKTLPYLVVIIDELADLMLVAAKEVEDSIMRITQMARAAGIHLIVATQRPSTDVITGVIKANIPSRIAFAVSSSIDSRTILDGGGAEKLLGKGDMLFAPMGDNVMQRVQGAYISEDEINKVINFVKNQQPAEFVEEFSNLESYNIVDTENEDPLYQEVLDFVLAEQKASTSLIQRRFGIGYNRAARLTDQLENLGIIGPQQGSKPREVLVKKDFLENEE